MSFEYADPNDNLNLLARADVLFASAPVYTIPPRNMTEVQVMANQILASQAKPLVKSPPAPNELSGFVAMLIDSVI